MDPLFIVFSYGYANSYGYVVLKSSTVHRHKLSNHKLQIVNHKLHSLTRLYL